MSLISNSGMSLIAGTMENSQYLPAGQLIGNRYKIIRPLGSGGMASVYLAEDMVLGETHVALKILRRGPQFKDEIVHRFLREVRLTHKINHENVVRTFDFGQEGETLFYTMEYLSGQTLDSLIRDEFMPLPAVLGIAVQLMRGISAVHAVGVVHRDLKPGNVMVLDEGRLKITDFGIARGGVSSLTVSSGEIVGTMAYLAPETLIGEEATIAVDYYALGAMLYQLLTGRLPIDDDIPARLIMRKVEELPADPRELRPDIPEWLAQGLLGLLEIDPQIRMRSLAAFAANLDKYAPRQIDEGLVSGLVNNTLSLEQVLADTPFHTRIFRRVRQGNTTTKGLLAILLSFFALPMSSTDTFARMELVQSDNLFIARGISAPHPDIMIVSMDEQSYSTLDVPIIGAWPRELHTRLINRLADDKAKRIVFDIIFKDSGQDVAADQALAVAMKRVPTILGAASGLSQRATLNGSFFLEELIKPAPIFEEAAAGIGIIGLPQRFGRVRNFLVNRSELFPDVPSLAEVASATTGNGKLGVLTPNADALIKFDGDARTIPTVPYEMVVADKHPLPAGTFTGKIVFVGLSLRSRTGPSQREAFVTPFDQGTFGTEIHATATSNLLKQDWIREVSPVTNLFICGALAAFVAFVVLALSGAKAIVMLMVTAAGILAFQFVLFVMGWFVPVLCPLIWGAFSGLVLRLLLSQSLYEGLRRRL